MNTLIGEFLTFISYFVYWVSRFFKRKETILIFDNISRFIAIVAFIFLSTFDGIKNTVYVIFRNEIARVIDKKKNINKYIYFIIMLTILIGIYIIGFNGLISIFILISGILNLCGVILYNEQGIRFFGILGSLFYALFMLSTSNTTGLICELICFIVMIVSFIKYKRKGEVIKRV